MSKPSLIAVALLAASAASHASVVLTEGFENVAGLGSAGWVQTNLSSPVGLAWGQGFVGPFAAQAGTAESYAVANFESAAFGSGGVIDNWLITPTLDFGQVNTLRFWTRTVFNPTVFPDRLEARLSLAGTSSATTDFTSLLTAVNPALTQTDYPNAWTEYTATFNAAPGTSGRIAFRYTVPSNFEADLIGLDSVTVTAQAVPEPQTAALALLGLGLACGSLRLRRRRPVRQFSAGGRTRPMANVRHGLMTTQPTSCASSLDTSRDEPLGSPLVG